MAIFKPAGARYHYSLESNLEVGRLLSSGPCEFVSALITAGGSAAVARVYDAKSAAEKNVKQSILIAANTGESTPYAPGRPIFFKRGMYIEFEQGVGNNASLHVAYD